MFSFAVYQGQEQHFKGNSTPFNRETVWSSGYNKTAPLYVLTSTLNKLRNQAIKLSSDYISNPSDTLWSDVNHLCLKKGPDGSQIVFCINNKSSSGDSYKASIGGFQPNDNVVEVLRCRTTTADGVGNVTMYMGQGEPRVYVPATVLKGTGLCSETQVDGPVEAKSGAAALGVTGGVFVAAVVGWAMMLVA
jgi:alpha-amylase